jgi:hypothetical protein
LRELGFAFRRRGRIATDRAEHRRPRERDDEVLLPDLAEVAALDRRGASGVDRRVDVDLRRHLRRADAGTRHEPLSEAMRGNAVPTYLSSFPTQRAVTGG